MSRINNDNIINNYLVHAAGHNNSTLSTFHATLQNTTFTTSLLVRIVDPEEICEKLKLVP